MTKKVKILTNKHNENFEKWIKKLPDISDHRSKEDVYRSIYIQMEEKKVQIDRSKWLVLTLATICSIVLLVIIIQNMEHISWNESSNDIAVENSANDEFSMYSAVEESEMQQDVMEGVTQNELGDLKGKRTIQESYIGYDNNEDNITLAVVSDGAQYVVPITLLVPSDSLLGVNTLYENIAQYVDMNQNGFQTLHFEELEFDIHDNSASILLNDTYSVQNSSTNYHLFRQMLDTIFTTNGVEQIEVSGTHSFVLEQTNFASDYIQNKFYKVYQYQNSEKKWLIPVYNSDVETIEQALEEMKKDEEAYHIHKTIPSDTKINTSSIDGILEVRVESSELLIPTDQTIFLESILATAKEFGFNAVRFYVNFDNATDYNLSEPIEVPDYINPQFAQ